MLYFEHSALMKYESIARHCRLNTVVEQTAEFGIGKHFSNAASPN